MQAMLTLRALPNDINADNDDVFVEDEEDDDEDENEDEGKDVHTEEKEGDRKDPPNLAQVVGHCDDMPTWTERLPAQSGMLVAEHERLIAENERVHAGTQDPDIENVCMILSIQVFSGKKYG